MPLCKVQLAPCAVAVQPDTTKTAVADMSYVSSVRSKKRRSSLKSNGKVVPDSKQGGSNGGISSRDSNSADRYQALRRIKQPNVSLKQHDEQSDDRRQTSNQQGAMPSDAEAEAAIEFADESKTVSKGVAAVQNPLTTQLSHDPQDAPATRPIKELGDNDLPIHSTTAANTGNIISWQHLEAEQFLEQVSEGPAPAMSIIVPPLVLVMASTLSVLCLTACFAIWVWKRGAPSQSSERDPPYVTEEMQEVEQSLLTELPTNITNHMQQQLQRNRNTNTATEFPKGSSLRRIAMTRSDQCPLIPPAAPSRSLAIRRANSTGDSPVSAWSSSYKEPLHWNCSRTRVRSERHSVAYCENVQDVKSLQ